MLRSHPKGFEIFISTLFLVSRDELPDLFALLVLSKINIPTFEEIVACCGFSHPAHVGLHYTLFLELSFETFCCIFFSNMSPHIVFEPLHSIISILLGHSPVQNQYPDKFLELRLLKLFIAVVITNVPDLFKELIKTAFKVAAM